MRPGNLSSGGLLRHNRAMGDTRLPDFDAQAANELAFEASRCDVIADLLDNGVLLHVTDSEHPYLIEVGSVGEALCVVRQIRGEGDESK